MDARKTTEIKVNGEVIARVSRRKDYIAKPGQKIRTHWATLYSLAWDRAGLEHVIGRPVTTGIFRSFAKTPPEFIDRYDVCERPRTKDIKAQVLLALERQ